MESALVIVIDDAEPFDAVRREFAVETFELGIPFHVTLLYPFAPTDGLSDDLLADVRAFFAAWPPFELDLSAVAAWPDVVYAVPKPAAEPRRCMQALFDRFPQWPPYGGIHDVVMPHATLAEDVEAAAGFPEVELRPAPPPEDAEPAPVFPEIERRVAPHLPRRCQARDVALLAEYEPNRWRER